MTDHPNHCYPHDAHKSCSSAYLAARVAAVCRRHGVRRVLDIGCGNGTLCRTLADAGLSVVGLDPSPSGIACARRLVPEGSFYEMGVEADPDLLPDAGFDAVVSTEVIEHLPSPALLLQFAAAKLRDRGILVISTPYHGYLKNLLISLSGRWDSHHTSLWDGGHIRFWSRRTLTRLFLENGFGVLEFHGAGRVPFLWKSMILVGRRAEWHGGGADRERVGCTSVDRAPVDDETV